MSAINNEFTKKIDFTKVGTILRTTAGVYYTSDGKTYPSGGYGKAAKEYEAKIAKDLPKPVILVQQNGGYGHIGYYISLSETEVPFLRMSIYGINGYRVGDYKENPHFYPTTYRRNYGSGLFEIRFFKDGSFVKIWRQEFTDGTVMEYIKNPAYKTDNRDKQLSYWGDHWHQDRNNPQNREKLRWTDENGNRAFILVNSPDEDLSAYAVKHTIAHKKLYYNDMLWTDLRKGVVVPLRLDNKNHSKDTKFAKVTKDLIYEFYGLNDSSWCGTVGSNMMLHLANKAKREEVEDLEDFICILSARTHVDFTAAQKAREDRQKSWAERSKEFTYDVQHSRQAIWDRQGDEIILTMYHDERDADWNHKSVEFNAFVYNVKTKKRTVIINTPQCQTSMPIPAEDLILALFTRQPYKYWSNGHESLTHEKYAPMYLKPFNEIFAGTNIEFLLQNIDKDHKIPNYQSCGRSYYYRDNTDIASTKLSEQLSPDNIDLLALKVLVSSQEPWLEQAIKCKLFNIYFAALYSKDSFVDRKKAEKDKWYGHTNNSMVVGRKDKNLKKAFGMTLEQLKLVDTYIGKYMFRVFDGSEGYCQWCVPSMRGMKESLGVDINKIDLKTFQYILDTIELVEHKSKQNSRYNRQSFSWDLHRYNFVCDLVLKNYTLKQKFDFLRNSGDLGTYNDYLRMRNQLKTLAETKHDDTIFNDDQFPIKVQKAVKFFHYRPGMRIGWGHYNNPAEFRQHYKYEFNEAFTEGRVQDYYDQDNKYIGFLADITGPENLKVLHDEASFWCNLYQDEAKQAGFMNAVKRANVWEYTDGELSIVAPKTISDLKTEGSVLSHCVGSFVDPIIENNTNVVFIRKNTFLNSPFYTMEILNSGEVRQIHCYRNGQVSIEDQRQAYVNSGYDVYKDPVDVIKFLKKWANAKKGVVKASTITNSYGMLCAHRG